MSLTSSLHTGASGLASSSLDLSVVGDNIANANTIGFKGSRVAFEEALAQSLMGAGGRGLGVNIQAIQRIITQGALIQTGLATDLALQGSGYFVVRGNHAGRDGSYYTRAGQFTVDSDGYLVNLDGLRVQGWQADAVGTVSGKLGDLALAGAASPPKATGSVTIKANLQADAAILPPWDPANPRDTSNFSSSVTIFDSLGAAHSVEVFYRKTADGSWEWHAMTDGGGLQGGAAGTLTEIAAGDLTFDTDGKLVSDNQTSNFLPKGATSPQALALDVTGMTQFANPSAVSFLNQDGWAAGDLAGITIDQEGRVVGAFTNGHSKVLGQLAVASFAAPDQLERLGGNLLGPAPSAGEPTIGTASSGGRAAIVAGALEQSNVDIATEFIRMIEAQRGFQANSKTVTTADQLLSDLIQLKR
ncbi:flagellar hook protein FlgE [Vulgatibacter incomptus]|uniref:Flagellar hook protein FlgE n=1 Tax=Vulgatibacter incomptus TaxID=1391653 RepID=A0A0K1PHY7_9BACT|nr:flagellar hook protein FlgE [Vulgatibacter incomptus]AKU93021.1 Flagellar hook protein FlgE [Vulgatibacter incomptus]